MNPIVLRILITAAGGAIGAVAQLTDIQGTVWGAVLTAVAGALAGGAWFRRPGDLAVKEGEVVR